MAHAFLGMIMLGSIAAMARKYLSTSNSLHRYDRIGAVVFFFVVGLPALIVGFALVATFYKA